MQLKARAEEWPLAKPFVIARGVKTSAHVVTVELVDKDKIGRGECVPYARYGESVESVLQQIESLRHLVEAGMTRADLRSHMPAGAARNALDCALWDLEAKQSGQGVYETCGLNRPLSVPSVETISIGQLEEMSAAAEALSAYPAIKVKLDDKDVVQKIAAIHKAAPSSQILIDANESWSVDLLNKTAPELKSLGVVMIEQPVAAGDDYMLASYGGAIPLAADESCHTSEDLADLAAYYQFANIKLDKAGGLTEALHMQASARELGLGVVVGSMVSTSLALAPAIMLTLDADYVDLDSPNLLAADRPNAMTLSGGTLSNIAGELWGGT